MTANGWLQLAVYITVLALLTKPLGIYLVRVLMPDGKTYLEPVCCDRLSGSFTNCCGLTRIPSRTGSSIRCPCWCSVWSDYSSATSFSDCSICCP